MALYTVAAEPRCVSLCRECAGHRAREGEDWNAARLGRNQKKKRKRQFQRKDAKAAKNREGTPESGSPERIDPGLVFPRIDLSLCVSSRPWRLCVQCLWLFACPENSLRTRRNQTFAAQDSHLEDAAQERRILTMATRTRYRLRGKSRDLCLECVPDFPLASLRSDEPLAEVPFSRHAIRKLADYFQVDVGILAANLGK